jgi:hypothetical protein
MGMVQSIEAGAVDAVSVLIAGLESEFGRGAGEALKDRFLAAEDADFHWDARVSERFLGSYCSLDEEDFELDRVAIIGRLDGIWFTAIVIVDGEGLAHGMTARRGFRSEKSSREAWLDAR